MVADRLAALVFALVLAACAGPGPAPETSLGSDPDLQCVPYARAVSGIRLAGDAWAWWQAAEGRYRRGAIPALYAVLVFSRTDRLPRGHLAVVTDLVGPREIAVAQANWVKGRITEGVSVIDASPRNDWSSVRVFNATTGAYGRVYATDGFIYGDRAVASDQGFSGAGSVYLLSRSSG